MIDDGTPGNAPLSGRVSAWLSEIEKAHNDHAGMSTYNTSCGVIRKRYRYEGSKNIKARHYQLLWSNIETMKSSVYAKPPHTTVSRRYRDADPVGRVASEMLERAINFSFDASDFDGVFKQVRDDFLLYGRGCARIYYEPEYETINDLNEDIDEAEDIGRVARDGIGIGRSLGVPDGNETASQGSSRRAPERNESDAGGRRGGVLKSVGVAGEEDQVDGNKLAFENVRIRFVQRADFRHQPARTWEEVQWLAFRAFMTRDEVTERFGEKIGKEIGLDSTPAETDDTERGTSSGGRADAVAKATVWEIWDKAKNRVLWIAKNWPEVLEEGPPYLKLDGFYPCPRPAYGTLTPDSLVPVPDYIFYQDQCEEIDQLTARIGALSDALKLVGFYPAGPQGDGAPEIEKALSPGFENRLIAVTNWAIFSGAAGPPIVWVPIDQVIKILEGCVKLRQQLVEDVYQIIGLSDIMRGASDPRETEGAQQLKAQFGGTRIRDRQQEIARFCRDISRLSGQVIAMYCSPDTVQKMTNIHLPTKQDVMMAQLAVQRQAQIAQFMQMQGQGAPNGMGGPGPGMMGQGAAHPQVNLGPTQEDVFGLLQDALTRRFKIDIENESTISGDESQARKDRSEFIVSVTKFMEAWGPMIIQKPELAKVGGQLLLFGVRAFPVGRELEESIDELAEKLAAEGAGPPQPNPAIAAKMQAEMIKLEGTKAKTQAEIAKSQIDGQTAQMAAQGKMAAIQMDGATKIAELKMKLAAAEQEHQHKTVEAGLAHGAAVDKMALQHQKAQADAAKMPAWPKEQKGSGF